MHTILHYASAQEIPFLSSAQQERKPRAHSIYLVHQSYPRQSGSAQKCRDGFDSKGIYGFEVNCSLTGMTTADRDVFVCDNDVDCFQS